MSVQYISPYTPLLYSKTGVRRGIPIFLIFALKHRLWVLPEAVLTCTQNLCFELVGTLTCTDNVCFEQK